MLRFCPATLAYLLSWLHVFVVGLCWPQAELAESGVPHNEIESEMDILMDRLVAEILEKKRKTSQEG